MIYHQIFNEHAVRKARIVCVCQTVEECQKLIKFGWVATTVLDEGGNPCVDWMRHLYPVMLRGLESKRIVIFPHNTEHGDYCAGRVTLALIGKSADLRIVKIPDGKDLMEFLQGITGSSEASKALEKIIGQAIPLTTETSWEIFMALKTIEKEIQKNQEYWKLLVELLEFESQFRQIQFFESTRRIKQVLPGVK